MAMKHFHKQRLLKIADFLESLPRGRFDLSVIGKQNDKGETPTPTRCGTAACAIGWTPFIFPRACSYIPGLFSHNELSVQSKKSENTDFSFAEEFFGLSDEESLYLFHPESYPEGRRGKKSVAKRIRAFVAGKVPQSAIDNRNW